MDENRNLIVLDFVLTHLSKVAYFLLFLLGFALDASPPDDLTGFLFKSHNFLRSNAWPIILLSLVLIGIRYTYTSFFKRRNNFKFKAEQILSHSRQHFFKEKFLTNDPEFHHRITLFKATRFCYRPRPIRHKWWIWGKEYGPMKGWLVPVARSEHSTKNVKSTFRIPEDGQGAEGAAGKAFFRENPFKLPSEGKILPVLTTQSSKDHIEEYANSTFVNEQWINSRLGKEKPLARSLFAFRIKCNGKPWGVMVVDSVDPDAIHEYSKLIRPIKDLRFLIEEVLERG